MASLRHKAHRLVSDTLSSRTLPASHYRPSPFSGIDGVLPEKPSNAAGPHAIIIHAHACFFTGPKDIINTPVFNAGDGSVNHFYPHESGVQTP